MEQGISLDAYYSALMADTERQFVGAANYADFGQDQYAQPQFGVEYGTQAQTQPIYADASVLTQWPWPPAPPYPVSNPLLYPIPLEYNYANAGLTLIDPYPLMPTIARPAAPSESAHIQAENKLNTGDDRVWQAGVFATPGTNEGQGSAMAQMADYHPGEQNGITFWAPQPRRAATSAPFIQRIQYEDTAYHSPPTRVPAPQLALHASAPPSIVGAAHLGLVKLRPTSRAVREGHTTIGSGFQLDAPVHGYGDSGVVQSASSVRLSVTSGALVAASDAESGSGDTGASAGSSDARSVSKDIYDVPNDIRDAPNDIRDTPSDSLDASNDIRDAPNDVLDASSDIPVTSNIADTSSIIANESRRLDRPRKAPTGSATKKVPTGGTIKKKRVKALPAPKKPQFMACFFCRSRKIACGHPPPDNPDRTCK
ncbi:hypothetical protein EWM64_g7898 [Hericium alpestre]|uniref:Uncharacterized protein n=1 Tax=Hericium alpestre TaxID=135208 RepID=A0A4Y9ZQ10_9AGAM|nr:hypothetical protein EWM64_g7898 [Hericium alpestre]